MDKLLKFLREWLHKWTMARVSLLQGIFPIQGLKSGLLNCRRPAILYHLSQRRDFYMYSINMCVCVQLLQSHLTLCNPMHCSPPDSSVHRVFPARILEWVVIPSSRGIFLTQGSNLCLLHLWIAGWATRKANLLCSPGRWTTVSSH